MIEEDHANLLDKKAPRIKQIFAIKETYHTHPYTCETASRPVFDCSNIISLPPPGSRSPPHQHLSESLVCDRRKRYGMGPSESFTHRCDSFQFLLKHILLLWTLDVFKWETSQAIHVNLQTTRKENKQHMYQSVCLGTAHLATNWLGIPSFSSSHA